MWKEVRSASFEDLLSGLRKERWTPSLVLHAFQGAALEATEATNCVCLFFEEAEEAAARLESEWKGREDKPGLYGLPICIKENIRVQGHDSTIGFAFNIGAPAKKDALIVAALRNKVTKSSIPFGFRSTLFPFLPGSHSLLLHKFAAGNEFLRLRQSRLRKHDQSFRSGSHCWRLHWRRRSLAESGRISHGHRQ